MNSQERPVRVGQKSDLPYRSELEQQVFFQRLLERAQRLTARKSTSLVALTGIG